MIIGIIPMFGDSPAASGKKYIPFDFGQGAKPFDMPFFTLPYCLYESTAALRS
jgi:hypothetical protein